MVAKLKPTTSVRVHTATGSVYEIDEESRMIRKTAGAPTRRLGPRWERYWKIMTNDESMLIEWPEDTPRLGKTSEDEATIPMTQTSLIVRVDRIQ